jgi:hypothetical protein
MIFFNPQSNKMMVTKLTREKKTDTRKKFVLLNNSCSFV